MSTWEASMRGAERWARSSSYSVRRGHAPGELSNPAGQDACDSAGRAAAAGSSRPVEDGWCCVAPLTGQGPLEPCAPAWLTVLFPCDAVARTG
ncbi:hypothetical protein [Amycolatopsis sp.]|uniref:hypothetical protein n=1 Tax=Amycolatopsis sp. TaxID=37632 RepID=UPI002E0B69B9|nr:hypothetical protein [Amycolatopsis sp.]